MKKLLTIIFLISFVSAIGQGSWTLSGAKNRWGNGIGFGLKDTGSYTNPSDTNLLVWQRPNVLCFRHLLTDPWQIVSTTEMGVELVSTIAQLQAHTGQEGILIVTDSLRGGVFTYSSASLTNNDGTIFTATGKGSGFWVRNENKGVLYSSWFGIDNTGVADAATKLRALFNLARATGSQKVYINSGTYKLQPAVDTTIAGMAALYGDPDPGHIADSVAIWMYGVNNLTIECIGNVNFVTSKSPLALYRCKNVNWIGGTFTYNGVTNLVDGPILYRSENVHIYEMRVQNFYRNISMFKNLNSSVEKCISTRGQYFNFYGDGRLDVVIDTAVVTDTAIFNGVNRQYFKNNIASHGVFGNYFLARTDAFENQSYNLNGVAGAHFYSQQGFTTISNNIIQDTVNKNGSTDNYGVLISPTGSFVGMEKVMVSGNSIKGTKTGIYAEGRDVIIEDNFISDWWSQGILYTSNAGSASIGTNISIQGNIISDINPLSTNTPVSPYVIGAIQVVEPVGSKTIGNVTILDNKLNVSSGAQYNLYVSGVDSVSYLLNHYLASGLISVNGNTYKNTINGSLNLKNDLTVNGTINTVSLSATTGIVAGGVISTVAAIQGNSITSTTSISTNTLNATSHATTGNLTVVSSGGSGGLGGQIRILTTSANAGARNWALVNTWDVFGDFVGIVGNYQGADPLLNGTKVFSFVPTGMALTGQITATSIAITGGTGSQFLMADGSVTTASAVAQSGTYTPTFTAGTNTTTATVYMAQYMKIGNVVTVSGMVVVNHTSSVASDFSLSLPFNSNFGGGNFYQLGGSAEALNNATGAPAQAFTANNVFFTYTATAGSGASFRYQYTYTIVP